MLLSKRDQARIERRLVATLTEACETAKAEIEGFSWLTHEVDYTVFPASLMVTWIFDTLATFMRTSVLNARLGGSEAVRARAVTLTPARPRVSAMARPIPRPAPVTSADAPASSMSGV